MANLSGATSSGIPYPVGTIDRFDPAAALQNMARNLDEIIQGLQAGTNRDIVAIQQSLGSLQGGLNQRPRFIRSANASAAATASANDPVNVYWVSL